MLTHTFGIREVLLKCIQLIVVEMEFQAHWDPEVKLFSLSLIVSCASALIGNALFFFFCYSTIIFFSSKHLCFLSGLVVKNTPANAGDLRDRSPILGLGRSPGGGQDNPLQYSCLQNPMDREAWRATVQRIAKSWTGLSN